MTSKSPFGMVFLGAIFLAAVSLVFMLPGDRGVQGSQVEVAVLWLAQVVCMCAALVLDPVITRRPLDWFSPRLYAMVLAAFGIARPLQILFDATSTVWLSGSQEDVTSLLIRTMRLSLLGQVALLFGYYVPLGRRIAGRVKPLRDDWRSGPLTLVLSSILVAGAIAYAAMMASAGGVAAFVNQLGYRRTMLEGQQYLLVITLMIPVALAAAWGFYLRLGQRPPVLTLALTVASLLMLATLGGRGAIASLAMLCVGLYHYLRRPLTLRYVAVLAFVGMLGMSLYQDLRVSTFQGNLDVEGTMADRSWLDSLTHMDEGMERTMVVVKGVPEEIPFQYFTTYSRLFTTVIPRSVWPDKPGLSEASIYSPLFGGSSDSKAGMYPAGSIGDFYLQMGAVGVALGLFVCGAWQRFAYEYMRLHPRNAANAIFYLLALTSGVFTLRNAGILDFTGQVAALFALCWLAGRRAEPVGARRDMALSSATGRVRGLSR